MRRLLLTVVVASLTLMIVAVTWAATNLNSSKSNIYREFPGTRLVSATTPLSGPNQTLAVFTTPSTGDFVLTQLCTSPVNGGVRLAATGFGGIAHTAASLCYNFQPGFIMPPSTVITCATTFSAEPGSHFCTIAGLHRE